MDGMLTPLEVAALREALAGKKVFAVFPRERMLAACNLIDRMAAALKAAADERCLRASIMDSEQESCGARSDIPEAEVCGICKARRMVEDWEMEGHFKRPWRPEGERESELPDALLDKLEKDAEDADDEEV